MRYLDGFHEVKLDLVGGQVDGTLDRPSYVALRGSPEELGPRLLAEAARRRALEVVGWEGAVTGRGLHEVATGRRARRWGGPDREYPGIPALC